MTHDQDGSGLDALFAQARDIGPSADLAARVMADAQAIQAQAPVVSVHEKTSWLDRLLGGLGGWSAVSGITAAGVVGLAVGLYAPDTVAGFIETDGLSLGGSSFDISPDMGDLWTEDSDV